MRIFLICTLHLIFLFLLLTRASDLLGLIFSSLSSLDIQLNSVLMGENMKFVLGFFLYSFYSDIIKMIKSRRLKCIQHTLGIHRYNWENKVKMYVTEIIFEVVS